MLLFSSMVHFFFVAVFGGAAMEQGEVEGGGLEHIWNMSKTSLPLWSSDEIWLL